MTACRHAYGPYMTRDEFAALAVSDSLLGTIAQLLREVQDTLPGEAGTINLAVALERVQLVQANVYKRIHLA